LGTFPAMLMMGGVGQVLGPTWRQRGVWVAGSFILLLGLITLGRGILPIAGHIAHGWPGGYPA
jgi:sulfite exporter TauE/SafE